MPGQVRFFDRRNSLILWGVLCALSFAARDTRAFPFEGICRRGYEAVVSLWRPDSRPLELRFQQTLGAGAWERLNPKFARTLSLHSADVESARTIESVIRKLGRPREGRNHYVDFKLSNFEATAGIRKDQGVLTVNLNAVRRPGQSYFNQQHTDSLGGGKSFGAWFTGVVQAGVREMERDPSLRELHLTTGNTLNPILCSMMKKFGFVPKPSAAMPEDVMAELARAVTKEDFQRVIARMKNQVGPDGLRLLMAKESMTWSLVIPRG